MKILIPTDDNITIASEFENAKTFRLLTILDKTIIDDALIASSKALIDKSAFGLRELSKEDQAKSNNKLTKQIAFASSISRDAENNLLMLNYEVFKTEEKDIFNALITYINKYAVMECDNCCCP